MLFRMASRNFFFSLGDTMMDFPPSYSILIRFKEKAGLNAHDLQSSILEMDGVDIFHRNGPQWIHRFPLNT